MLARIELLQVICKGQFTSGIGRFKQFEVLVN